MRRHKSKREGLFERMRSVWIGAELPIEPLSGYRIELVGRKLQSRALVSGARRILVCNGAQVVLETKEQRICFDGADLDCLCYEGGVAEIFGSIKGFSLNGLEGI